VSSAAAAGVAGLSHCPVTSSCLSACHLSFSSRYVCVCVCMCVYVYMCVCVRERESFAASVCLLSVVCLLASPLPGFLCLSGAYTRLMSRCTVVDTAKLPTHEGGGAPPSLPPPPPQVCVCVCVCGCVEVCVCVWVCVCVADVSL
jgi:hypothetical protein